MTKLDENMKKIIEHAKPDTMMAMEHLKKANDMIGMLSNNLKIAESRWSEMFVVLGTVLNKHGREILLDEDDMISLDPINYKITVEMVDETNQRVVRLRHVSDN
jgi:hypothetical protein